MNASVSGDNLTVLQIRLTESDKKSFLELCKDSDTSAAREIRAFIKSELKKKAQKTLF